MNTPLKVLLVEDHETDAELLLLELRRAGFAPEFRRVDTESDYVAHLDPGLDVILADYSLPQFDGLRALELLDRHGLDIPFILVSGSIGEELATSVMRRGAADYLLKDRPARLGPAVANALEQRRLRLAKRQSEAELRASEERFRAAADGSFDAFYVLRYVYDSANTISDFVFVDVNKRGEERTRQPREAIIGQTLSNVLPNSRVDGLFEKCKRVVETNRALDEETLVEDLNRAARWFHLQVIPLSDGVAVTSRDITERKQAEGALLRAHVELESAYDATLEGWSKALSLRDQETESHTARVTQTTLQLARALGVLDDQLVHVRRGALLHDIGKMGIPDSILLKPGPLTEYEWEIMRLHPTYAHQMLSPIAYLRPALDIPYCHHERWDGAGYPRGLKGEEIPLAARIFAIVDVWDALSYNRPYRPAWPPGDVLTHLQSLAGKHFDPQVVQGFMALVAKMPTAGSASEAGGRLLHA